MWEIELFFKVLSPSVDSFSSVGNQYTCRSLFVSLTVCWREPVVRINWNNLRTLPALFAASISTTFLVPQASRSARMLFHLTMEFPSIAVALEVDRDLSSGL